MGKVTHDTIKIILEKPKQTTVKINDKGKYPVVKVLKGTIGAKGADGTDGGIYIPSFSNNTMFWTKEINMNNAPDSVNLSFSIDKISNIEILNVINNGD